MRTILFTAALAAAALLPLNSAAQGGAKQMTLSLGATQGEDEEKGSGEEAAPRPEGSATVAPGDGKSEAPGARHTVEKGDTLWDLSQRYLGSPWYWPKVWSYNPEIANPHWIYPGNLVRFFSTGEEAPTQVEVGQPEQIPDVEEGAMIDESDRVIVVGKIGYVPKKAITVTGTPFVTAREIEESGTIVGSFGEQDMLSFPEQGYVEFGKKHGAKVGETFVLFRTVSEILHPVTKATLGYLTRILGQARVVRVEKSGLATIAIVRQFDEIRRGDLVGPMGESLTTAVAYRPNEREVKDGVVVSATVPYLTQFAEHHMVIIDRGGDDGVKVGNLFTIWRQNDLQSQQVLLNPTLIDERFPREDVANCMAVDVKAKATTCLLTRSMRELVRGDRADMRASDARSASR